MQIRKLLTIVEETVQEHGCTLDKPTRKVAAVAVIKNPLAGEYQDGLGELIDVGEQLGGILAQRVVAALDGEAGKVESYGKAAIVGEAGELDHAAAILHPKFGRPVREAVGGGKAIISSTKKGGGPGTAIDAPLFYKDAVFVFSHLDSMEVRVPDAPRADEIVVALIVTDSGRPLPRVGGLQKHEIIGKDGLR